MPVIRKRYRRSRKTVMKSSFVIAALWAICVSSPVLAANGSTAEGTQMYAGPSTEYPQVMRLAGGLQVTIHGCMTSWAWCDVSWRGNRGWVSAASLAYHLDQNRLPIADYGAQVGLPHVGFKLNSYWETHYRERPWYAERSLWSRRMTGASSNALAEAR